MNCCFSDKREPECDAERLDYLPMCAKHLRLTFRSALVAGVLPADVFKALCADAVAEFTTALEYRDLSVSFGLREDREARQREAHEKRDREGVVYYVQLTGGRVKIGWTRDLANRMAIFRARPEDVLATEPGGRTKEAQRHREFATDRIGRSEEFVHSEQLAAHIARLTMQGA